jgi:exodeoxyribonuclease V alpha subunit
MANNGEHLEGTVQSLVYYNEANQYGVARIQPTTLVLGNRDGTVILAGIIPALLPGEMIHATGSWQTHPKYGRQFQAQHVERVLPSSKAGIIEFLAKGPIKRVGRRTAERIVEAFGEDTFQVLDSEEAVAKLTTIKHVTPASANEIIASWRLHREEAATLSFLYEAGLGPALAARVYRQYSEHQVEVVEAVKANPYRLMYDIRGIGFQIADQVAQNLGLAPEDIRRLGAGLHYVLDEANNEGHLFLPLGELLRRATEILRLAPELEAPLQQAVQMMLDEGRLTQQNIPPSERFPEEITAVYIAWEYRAENRCARYARELIQERPSALAKLQKLPEAQWDWMINRITLAQSISLNEAQIQGIRQAISHKISILTGGPGTGKTTTLNTLIAILGEQSIRYALASPTGRAAKRLQQATGQEAQTVHRLLGFDGTMFQYDESQPLEVDFVVVDEASMVDLYLFDHLLRAIPKAAHLLLVGDVDQLPSVGAGDVLHDLIRSGACPVTRLGFIFRQGKNSLIVQNAHAVNQGEMPRLSNDDGTDFYFIAEEDPDRVAEKVVRVVQERIPKRFGFHSLRDVQVLAPMYRSPVGVDALNTVLQAALNAPHPEKNEIRVGKDRLWREGDKVLQTKNNYDKRVFNGDVGLIAHIDPAGKNLTVEFEEEIVSYTQEDFEQLTLAYASSVHRAQGSEYPAVVLILSTQHYMMLQRNLFYTALTRGRRLAVLVGSVRAVQIAVQNDKVAHRWTALDWRLAKALEESRT